MYSDEEVKPKQGRSGWTVFAVVLLIIAFILFLVGAFWDRDNWWKWLIGAIILFIVSLFMFFAGRRKKKTPEPETDYDRRR